MSIMVGYCFPDQELILYNKTKKEERKHVGLLPIEYFWKLLGMLPPIPDVPPPLAKHAFAELLRKPRLDRRKPHMTSLLEKEQKEGLSDS